jgi:chromosomal replication initiator protein
LELRAEPELVPGWREICAELRRAVGDSAYEIWLSALKPTAWDGRRLVLEGPGETHAWIARRYGRILEKSARAVLGAIAQVQLEVEGSSPSHRADRRRDVLVETEAVRTLNPRYSFEQFVIGDGNRMAHAAALAVAELPAGAYNPLFIHSSPGLGKTHLLHAIGNYTLAFGGGARVRYTTVEAFTNHFIAALATRSIDRFKHAYRDTDVLLIDDVQFLASKAKTEEEFFHTFNALYESGRQLILTCDRLPRQLVAVEERLRERFEAGLVAEILPPDLATRVAILRKRAALDGISLADDTVLEFIAERVSDNVRALEGALIRIVAHHSLTGRPIDLSLASDVLEQMYPGSSSQTVSIAVIQSAVASTYRISVAELTSSSRAARIAWPRQLAIHLARELTTSSLNAIGDAFGGRNHATILHACKRVSERLLTDPEVTAELESIRTSLRRREGDRSC